MQEEGELVEVSILKRHDISQIISATTIVYL